MSCLKSGTFLLRLGTSNRKIYSLMRKGSSASACALCWLSQACIPRRKPFLLRSRLPELELWPFGLHSWTDSCFPLSFAVATPLAQRTCLKALPVESSCHLLAGNIHLVHEMVRHVFLDRITMLLVRDLRFLSDATFPGFTDEPSDLSECGV
mmetsp:Transcript_6928/g.15783  ORF Transcript_6928/g.15783 Transcript_6928/m.15783 type:complete len:152 (+) Transcript_6928:923-1378(+)